LATAASSGAAQLLFDWPGKKHFPPSKGRVFAKAMGDIDGDGAQDVLIGHSTNTPGLYINDGTGRFTERGAVRGLAAAYVHTPRDAEFSDVDGDGDLDLVLVTNHQDYAYSPGAGSHLALNLRRQLTSPFMVVSGGTYQLDIVARTASATSETAVPLLSTGSAMIRLAALGIWWLDPSATVALPAATIPQPAGELTLLFNMPPVAATGLELHAQTVLLSGAGGLRLSNPVSDTIIH
jgi:hypothetical protein